MDIDTTEISFHQFQASRERVENLADVLPENCVYEASNPGYVYEGGVYIEEQSDGRVSLLIYRDEYVALPHRLATLEAILYQWALGELFWVDNTPEQSTAKATAEAIFKFTTLQQTNEAIDKHLLEPLEGVCRLQDVADVWPLLAANTTAPVIDLDVAYELLRGLVAYRMP